LFLWTVDSKDSRVLSEEMKWPVSILVLMDCGLKDRFGISRDELQMVSILVLMDCGLKGLQTLHHNYCISLFQSLF